MERVQYGEYVIDANLFAIKGGGFSLSGAKDRRPALDQLLADARRRRFDVLVCWRLDRLGRNLRHLVTLIDELTAIRTHDTLAYS